jgi:hypothetical protein
MIPPGAYNAYVYCDAADQVDESDESNNVFLLGEVSIGPEGRPDLVLRDTRIVPAQGAVGQGERLSLEASVCNRGEAYGGRVHVRALAVSVPFGERELQRLADVGVEVELNRGECSERFRFDSARLECFDPEEFFVMFIVDPRNRVDESDEENNSVIGQAELRVECEPTVCIGDQFDPDDQLAPPTIELGGTYELRMCPDDVDRMHIPWSPGARASLLVLSVDGLLNITVYAFDGDRVQILAEGNTEDGGYQYTADELGDADRYVVEIRAEGPHNGFDYLFTADGREVMMDGVDLAVGEVSMSPEPFRGGETKSIRFTLMNQGDEAAADYNYRIGLLEGTQIAPDPQPDEYLLRLEDVGPRLAPRSSQAVLRIVLLPEGLEEGRYTLVVKADSDDNLREVDEGNNLGLFFFTVGDPPECETDALEENDSFEDAREVELGEYADLSLCESDDDFYLVCAGGDGTLQTTVRFTHQDGDVDMRLLTEEGEVVELSNGVRDEERIDVDGVEEGDCFVLHVYLFGRRDAQTTYDMQLRLDGDTPVVCTDEFEPNNGFIDPTPLEEGADSALLDFCPEADTDFFLVRLGRGDRLSVGVEPSSLNAVGSIGMTLYGPDRGFLIQRFERAPSMEYQAAAEGDHYLRLVTSSSGQRFPYRFTEFQVE